MRELSAYRSTLAWGMEKEVLFLELTMEQGDWWREPLPGTPHGIER